MNIKDVIDGLELLARDVPFECAVLCMRAAQLLDAAQRLRVGVDMHEGFAIVTKPMDLKIGMQCWDALTGGEGGDQKTPDEVKPRHEGPCWRNSHADCGC